MEPDGLLRFKGFEAIWASRVASKALKVALGASEALTALGQAYSSGLQGQHASGSSDRASQEADRASWQAHNIQARSAVR